jgi:6-phosphogluconate dehydrogenase (decarboxylating)
MPEAPVLHSQATPPPPPAGEKGVWFPLKDAGALMIYLDKLKGKCREDDVVIDRGNAYLKEH